MTVSIDDGMTWMVPVNVTQTTVPVCDAGDCASEHWSSMAERVDTHVYVQYILDRDAGDWLMGEGVPTENDVLCGKVSTDNIPLENKARISWSPKGSYKRKIHVPTIGQKKLNLHIGNMGTATLSNISITETAPWLSIGSYNMSISPGGCPEIVELTITGQGAEEFYVDSIHVTSNDQAGNSDFYVRLHVVMSDVYVTPEWAIVTNPLFRLEESNVGNMGNGNDTAGMYLYEDPSEPNFLFDGSPLLAFTTPSNDSVVGRYIFDDEYLLPETELMVDTSTDLKTIVVEAEFCPVTPQVPLPWHHAWWFWTIKMKDYIFYSWEGQGKGTENKNEQYLALKYIQLYYNPPPPWWPFSDPLPSVTKTYLGMGLDVDAISDSGAMNNPGSYDDVRRMTYIQGYGGAPNENYRLAIAQRDTCCEFDLPYYPPQTVTCCWPDPGTVVKDIPYAMHILRNDSTIYPYGGYDDAELYKWMSTPGDSIQRDFWGDAPPTDYNIVTTGRVIPAQSFPPTDTYEVAYALVVTDEFELDKMNNCVDMIICGNVNRDNQVSIADVVYFISFLFKDGPEIWRYMGDVNSDGVPDISDCVYLVSYLFRNGPPPQCSSL